MSYGWKVVAVAKNFAIADESEWDDVPDYVFEADYSLTSLEQVESFIQNLQTPA